MHQKHVVYIVKTQDTLLKTRFALNTLCNAKDTLYLVGKYFSFIKILQLRGTCKLRCYASTPIPTTNTVLVLEKCCARVVFVKMFYAKRGVYFNHFINS